MKRLSVWLCALAIGSTSSAFAQFVPRAPMNEYNNNTITTPAPEGQTGWTMHDLQLVRRYVEDHKSILLQGGQMALSGLGVAYLGSLIPKSGGVTSALNWAIQAMGYVVVADAALNVVTQGRFSPIGHSIERFFGIPKAQAAANYYKGSPKGLHAFTKLNDEQAAFYLDNDPEFAQMITEAAALIRHNDPSYAML